jgi:hypothetical protein
LPAWCDDSQVDEDRQRERARQYAVCTYALRHDRASDGAEAIYDQALTNGLAAIVTHNWPGEEMERPGGRTRAARGLVRVIEKRAAAAADGIVHVPHSEDVPDYEDHPALGRIENFTRVNVAVLRDALYVTQEVRHARATGEQGVTLADEHIKALVDLEYHPALFAISDELVERAQAGIAGRDAAERARAWAYFDALDAEERERRQAINYADQHAWETPDDRSVVDDCPVCGTRALVAPEIENVIGEIGIGFCFVCSYQRTDEFAEEVAYQLDIDRAIGRAVERDD